MLESELARLLEGTADAAFSVDLQGEIRTWNQAAERFFGYPASLAIGKSCAALIGGRSSSNQQVCRERCEIRERVEKGRDIPNFDLQVPLSSKQRLWVNVSILVAANERTERRLVIHFVRDIAKRKFAEDQTNRLLRAARSLVSSADQIGDLPPVSPLTGQERKILKLLAAGKTSTEVASELQISMRTLRNHLTHVNQKLHTRTRLEAVLEVLKRGII